MEQGRGCGGSREAEKQGKKREAEKQGRQGKKREAGEARESEF
jgi:hypothetical protein